MMKRSFKSVDMDGLGCSTDIVTSQSFQHLRKFTPDLRRTTIVATLSKSPEERSSLFLGKLHHFVTDAFIHAIATGHCQGTFSLKDAASIVIDLCALEGSYGRPCILQLGVRHTQHSVTGTTFFKKGMTGISRI